MQLFQNSNEDYKSVLDPRTKLVLLIALNVVIIGTGFEGLDYLLRIVCAIIPFVLFLIIRRPRTALIYGVICLCMLFCEGYLIPHTTGWLNLVIVITVGAFSRMLVGMAFAYYMMLTTTVSEFITAMKAVHMPDQITIPLSVMFRFFPTLAEESAAINDAMRLRGIKRLGGKGGIVRSLEYQIVPLMMSTLRIGDELSAASLSKGLEAGAPRTHICNVRMECWDWLLIALGVAMMVYMFFLR